MWEFLTKVYEGNNGGVGLFLIAALIIIVLGDITMTIIKKRKPK